MSVNAITVGKTVSGFSGRSTPHVPVIPIDGPGGFSALTYQCKLNVDWDGAPKAYGKNRDDSPPLRFPLQKHLSPWEVPGNNGSLQDARADSDGHWVGVCAMNEKEAWAVLTRNYPATPGSSGTTPFAKRPAAEQHSIFSQFLDTRADLQDVQGKFPVVQLAEMGGVEPGYYVSTCNAHTGVTDDEWDQRRYVDASQVPYAALPNLPKVHLGDFGLVIRRKTGDSVGFFFGDTGAGSHLGECSGAVKLELAPERNAEDEKFTFLVFPGSGGGVQHSFSAQFIALIINNQLKKLANTGNQLADLLGGDNPTDMYTMRTALYGWGAPGPPTVPMKL